MCPIQVGTAPAFESFLVKEERASSSALKLTISVANASITNGIENIASGLNSAALTSTFQGGGSQAFVVDYANLTLTVAFDMSDSQRPAWRIASNSSPSISDWVTSQYLRFGKAGVYVIIDLWLNMNTIHIYDIHTGQWSVIMAKGDIPSTRKSACTAVSAAADDSSFQLHLFGGETPAEQPLNDFYVLLMPAFLWIKVQTNQGQNFSGAVSQGRTSAECITYKERPMLVVGGLNVNATQKFVCDPAYPMVKLLDTSTFEWQTQYPLRNTTYYVPNVVSDLIGGGPSGGARPAAAWQQTLGDKVSLYNQTIPRYFPPSISHASISNKTTDQPYSGPNQRPKDSKNIIAAVTGPIGGYVCGFRQEAT